MKSPIVIVYMCCAFSGAIVGCTLGCMVGQLLKLW